MPLTGRLLGLAATAAAYRVAYVEHRATSPCGQGSCGPQTLAQNAATYAEHAQTAAREGAALIVFPEYGLTGFSSYAASAWVQGGYTETIPAVNASARAVPCDDATGAFASAATVVTLSCAARGAGLAIVANLADDAGTSSTMYNTDVVLDSDGALVAAYRKLNLWGEANMATPSECERVTFSPVALAGRTFGLVTCADLIYAEPTLALADAGVSDFVAPVAWDDSMAQMQVLGWAQGFSSTLGVNLVIANHRGSAESGSGAFASGDALAYTFSRTAGGDSDVRIADLPDKASARRDVDRGVAAARPAPRDATAAAQSGWEFAALSDGSVCSGGICCTASPTSGTPEGFALAALDGVDTSEGLAWGAQACAILPCPSPAHSCLNYQTPKASATLAGVSLNMTGIGATTLVVPEIVATSSEHEQVVLAPGSQWNLSRSDGRAGLLVDTADDAALLSLVLYGRRFEDDVLPYSCS